MNSKARITSDFPTPGEVASRLRIPADRVAELERRLFDLHVTHPDGSITVIPFKDPAGAAGSRRNGGKASTVRAAKAQAKKK